jgi:hypothetical protein
MDTQYDGPQIVGMDLHRRRSVLVRMTPEGERLGKARIVNSPPALREEIGKAGFRPKVVFRRRTGGTGPQTLSPRPARRCIWPIRWG